MSSELPNSQATLFAIHWKRQLDFALATAAVIGISRMPRPAAAFAQRAIRSIEAGTADATPTATPRSRASRFEPHQRAIDVARRRT